MEEHAIGPADVGSLTDLIATPKPVDPFDHATTKSDDELLHEAFDQANVPRVVASPDDGSPVTLSPLGRALKLAADRDKTTRLLETALNQLAARPQDPLITARQLLAASTRFLGAVEQTANLRQQINLFLRDTKF